MGFMVTFLPAALFPERSSVDDWLPGRPIAAGAPVPWCLPYCYSPVLVYVTFT